MRKQKSHFQQVLLHQGCGQLKKSAKFRVVNIDSNYLKQILQNKWWLFVYFSFVMFY